MRQSPLTFSATFTVTFAPPSVSLSLGFKCFIAPKLNPTQNIYIINTIVGVYFLDLYTVHVYLICRKLNTTINVFA